MGARAWLIAIFKLTIAMLSVQKSRILEMDHLITIVLLEPVIGLHEISLIRTQTKRK